MDRTFEYTVLAYLDGQLDRREERAFLRDVARDPAKRAVLAQHRQLNAALGDRKSPVAVPLKTQQALAEKLPALQEVVPKAVPAGAGIAGGTTASFFSGKIVSLIVAGGALLGSIGFVILSGTSTDAPNPAAEREGMRGTQSAVTAQSPSGASAFRETAGEATSSQQPAERTVSPAEASAADRTRPAEPRAADRTAGHAAANPTATRESDAVAEVLPGTARRAETPATAPGTHASDAWETGTRLDVPAVGHRSITGPLAESAAADAPVAHPLPGHAHLVERNTLRELFDGKLYAYLETGAAQYDMQGTESTARSMTRGVYLAGLRYDFSPSVAAGLEFGQSTFAREGYRVQRSPLAPGSGTEIVMIDNALISENQPWLRAHVLWTLNPEQRLRLQADAGSGVLLGSDNALLFSVGVSSVYALSPALQARAGLHYSGTWLSPTGTPPVITSGSGVIGIIHNARDAGTAYSSAIEFRVGFGVLIW